ncbi:class I SAM-dependent methyltransferase [Paludibacteraceae bacterium OttesenSCG-928-F17]|nr:class I SAM-dependent methyltransferase [Paludibacteraceae bacterium OttesenSCG-928-F17]
MVDSHKPGVDLNKVRDMYNAMPEIWPDSDKWYSYTHSRILSYIQTNQSEIDLSRGSAIVNIGSGGNDYGILGNHYHIDIAEDKIKHCARYFVGSAESLPFPDDYFDFGLCLGSVINYCDPMMVISEISRVLKPGAVLFLDFEQSKSLQFFGRKGYDAKVSLIKSFNSGNEDYVWVFSLNHITSLCRIYNLTAKNVEFFHSISPLIYRISKNEMFAAKFVTLDRLTNKLPYLNKVSCNVILTVQKVLK